MQITMVIKQREWRKQIHTICTYVKDVLRKCFIFNCMQNRLISRLDVPISEEPSTPPPPPAPATKLPELRQILKAAKPFVGSCIGSSTGCAICVLVLGRLPLGTAPTACTGPCFVGTFGSCGSLLGRVFSETTVICTELFRQGLLDAETFIADSEFGRYMSNASPYTMEVKKSLLNADFLVANNNQNIFPL